MIFTAGDEVIWKHEPRGGYGYIFWVPASVVRVGLKRVAIDAQLQTGGVKQVWVKPDSLIKKGTP